eukprot:2809014-Rhodomonas_salina.2
MRLCHAMCGADIGHRPASPRPPPTWNFSAVLQQGRVDADTFAMRCAVLTLVVLLSGGGSFQLGMTSGEVLCQESAGDFPSLPRRRTPSPELTFPDKHVPWPDRVLFARCNPHDGTIVTVGSHHVKFWTVAVVTPLPYLGPKKLLRCALAVLLLRVASFLVAMITIWDSSTFSGGICDFDGELGSFVMAMLTITGIAELDLVVLLIINRTVMPKRGTLLTFAAADDGVAEEATVQKGHIRQARRRPVQDAALRGVRGTGRATAIVQRVRDEMSGTDTVYGATRTLMVWKGAMLTSWLQAHEVRRLKLPVSTTMKALNLRFPTDMSHLLSLLCTC